MHGMLQQRGSGREYSAGDGGRYTVIYCCILLMEDLS